MAAVSEKSNIDPTSFTTKRKSDDAAMEVELHKGIEGTSKSNPPKAKRRKSNKYKSATTLSETKDNVRKVHVPNHRYTPLKENWLKIFSPIVEHLQLQVRFNLQTRCVEIKACDETPDIGNLQKAADFVKAFILGFDVDDAIALLRLNDLFIESFEMKDVKTLHGDHQSRAIGRLAGKGGKTKFSIENATKTRIILADTRIHILGSFQNIQIARRAICNLIIGLPPSKIYGQLRNVAHNISQRI